MISLRLVAPGTRNISFVARARMLEKIKTDDNFCGDQLESGHFLLYHKGKPLLTKAEGSNLQTPSWFDFATAQRLSPTLAEGIAALGVNTDGIPTFAAEVGEEGAGTVEKVWGGRFTDLRMALFLVDTEVAHTLSKGWSLLTWRRSTKFCTKCGSPLTISMAGAGASCTSCTAVFYPTTAPVGIVSIGDPSTDTLLLIRQPRYPPGMYSCIAGFMDPGEPLEECVRREVAEEVGLEVGEVSYIGSQHWPFPAGSVMIGCHAQALPGQTPDPCPVELEDARWFSRAEVAEAKARIDANPMLRLGRRGDPDPGVFLAPRGAIAYRLASTWLQQGGKS